MERVAVDARVVCARADDADAAARYRRVRAGTPRLAVDSGVRDRRGGIRQQANDARPAPTTDATDTYQILIDLIGTDIQHRREIVERRERPELRGVMRA